MDGWCDNRNRHNTKSKCDCYSRRETKFFTTGTESGVTSEAIY